MSEPTTMSDESPHDHMVIPTVEQLITAHLTYLAAGGMSQNTVADVGKVLRLAHKQLPIGLSTPDGQVAATEEFTAWLAGGRTSTGKPWSAQTKSTYRQHLRRYHQWLITEGHIDWDPTATLRRPHVPAGTPRPATDAQAHIATTSLPMPFLLAARLAAFQGYRCIEMIRAQRDQIGPKVSHVHGKGDRWEIVPTHPRVWEIVQHMPDGPLITRRRGWPVTDQWMSQQGAIQLRRAGAHITMHQLRHWYATQLLRTSGNMEKVRRLMRHRSMASTQVYTLVEFDELAAAVLDLPDVTGP